MPKFAVGIFTAFIFAAEAVKFELGKPVCSISWRAAFNIQILKGFPEQVLANGDVRASPVNQALRKWDEETPRPDTVQDRKSVV